MGSKFNHLLLLLLKTKTSLLLILAIFVYSSPLILNGLPSFLRTHYGTDWHKVSLRVTSSTDDLAWRVTCFDRAYLYKITVKRENFPSVSGFKVNYILFSFYSEQALDLRSIFSWTKTIVFFLKKVIVIFSIKIPI